MKKHITSAFLILILLVFFIFSNICNDTKEVLSVITPTKFAIDLNGDKTISNDEIICSDNIEAFSLEPSDIFTKTYTEKFKISEIDILDLGFLAQEFAQKEMLAKNVKLDYTGKVSSECTFANIKINDSDYATILKNSGYGIVEGNIGNKEKFKKNLENSQKLNLVVLNHNSNKYHTLDCKYGKLAHDKIILPFKQIPNDAKPCKYCRHDIKIKHSKLKQVYNIPNIKSPELINSDGDLTLFYTDFTKHLKPDNKCNTNECKSLRNLINNSKDSIDIAIYGYDEVPAITQALISAKSRGVKIRFVYDESHEQSKTFYKDNNIIKELAQVSKSDKNISASKSNMLMHNKFIIFDNSIVFTGSMNFSKTGLSGYDENNSIIISSKDVANYYKREFEQMLEGKFHKDKLNHSGSNHFKIGSTLLEIYFSPQDKTSNRIIQLINSSAKYIYVPAFLITHGKITQSLISAHKRGVDVKIIIDANSTNTQNTKHKILRDNGIPLKTENFAGKLHSKTMIIDDEYIIMGSMNFSNSGENKNDENVIVIKNTNFAKNYAEFFKYLWQIIPDKYLKFNAHPESFDSIGSCSDGVDNNFNGKIDMIDESCQKL